MVTKQTYGIGVPLVLAFDRQRKSFIHVVSEIMGTTLVLYRVKDWQHTIRKVSVAL